MILECKNCAAVVDATVLHQYEDDDTEELPATWFFCKCPRCTLPMLAISELFDDDSPPRRVFPPAERRELGIAVPKNIQAAFKEAVQCFKAKAFTASAIMCRKTLEGLCAAHEAKSGNLAKNLAKLRDEGVIETRLFEWAEELRVSGNEAAHGVDSTVSRQDCEDILEFTEALAQYVFTYRHKFQQFKERRAIFARNDGVSSEDENTHES
jgi:hypothetical protein